MRKIALVVFVALLAISVAAAAIEINSKFYTEFVPDGAVGTFEWSSGYPAGLPGSFTIWSGDAAQFWITFYPGGAAESLAVHVPAGRSITMPMPALFDSNTAGVYTYHTKFTVAGHTDTLFVLPWGN